MSQKSSSGSNARPVISRGCACRMPDCLSDSPEAMTSPGIDSSSDNIGESSSACLADAMFLISLESSSARALEDRDLEDRARTALPDSRVLSLWVRDARHDPARCMRLECRLDLSVGSCDANASYS